MVLTDLIVLTFYLINEEPQKVKKCSTTKKVWEMLMYIIYESGHRPHDTTWQATGLRPMVSRFLNRDSCF